MATLNNIISEIKKNKWWVEQAPGSYFLFDYIMKTFVHAEKIVGYPSLKKILYITKNNIGFEITSYREKIENFKKIYAQELSNHGHFVKILKPWATLRRRLLELNKIAINKTAEMKNEDFVKFAKEFFQIRFDSVVFGAFIECVDPFTEDLPAQIQKKYDVAEGELQKIISVLAVQKTRSFLTQEKLDFFNLCLEKITEEEYLNKWFWIQSNYKESQDITLNKLRQNIKTELKQHGKAGIKKLIANTLNQEKKLIADKKIIRASLKFDKKDKILFSLLEKFAEHIDLRKESMLRHTYAMDKFLQIIEKRFPYSLEEFRSMRDDEFVSVLNGKQVDLKKIRQRHKISAMYYTPSSETEFSGKDAEKIYQVFMATFKSAIIKGMVASAPVKKLTGKVSVVMDVNRENFRPGTILVTSMTRPEFMPLMRKAKAVITDEGGLTCHAAIVSRELGIPCIIGTKNATKVLKNGNEVVMDLENGIIRKINQA